MPLATLIALSLSPGWLGARPVSTPAPAASCAQVSTEKLMQRVQERYRNQSLAARFEQTYVDAITGAKAPERGHVALDQSGRMRFVYEAPEAKIFVFDGQSAAFEETDARQVTVLDHFADSHAGAALALLTGKLSALRGIEFDKKASADADKAAADSPGGCRRLVFRPRGGKGAFARAELGVDAATCQIAQVRVVDAIGNASVYRLFERRLNVTFGEDTFLRRVPAGFDVLHVDASPPASP